MREVQHGNAGESNLSQINNALKDEAFADPEYVDSLFTDVQATRCVAAANDRAQASKPKTKTARENARALNSASRRLLLLLAIFAGTIALAFALNLNSNPSALGVLKPHKENSLGGRNVQSARNLNVRPIVAPNKKNVDVEIKATNDISWKEDVKFVPQTSLSPIDARFAAHKKIKLSYYSLDEDTRRRFNAELLKLRYEKSKPRIPKFSVSYLPASNLASTRQDGKIASETLLKAETLGATNQSVDVPTSQYSLALKAITAKINASVAKPKQLPSSKIRKETKTVVKKTIAQKSIANVKIGDRTVGINPLGNEGLGENVFYEIPHFIYQLKFNDDDGSEWNVNLLRPYNWLAITLTRIRDGIGGATLDENALVVNEYFPILPFATAYYLDVWLDSPEIGYQGWANVVAVDTTITITPGAGNLVTGTFKHTATEVYDLYIEGQSKPIGCTKTHPFWSVDRQDFIPVEFLRRDERVQCFDGQVKRILELKRRPKPEPVYNLEIFNEHVFCVSEDGILVHNHCPGNLRKADKFIRYVSQEELTAMGLPKLGNKIKGEQFFKPHGLKLNKNSNVKNIAEVNGSVFPSRLKASKSKYPFKLTIYVDKDTRDAIAKWGAAIKPCNGHNGTLAIPAEFLTEFNNHIIGLSVIKVR